MKQIFLPIFYNIVFYNCSDEKREESEVSKSNQKIDNYLSLAQKGSISTEMKVRFADLAYETIKKQQNDSLTRRNFFTAGHAIVGVINQNQGDLFVAHSRIEQVLGANGVSAAITHITNSNQLGTHPFYSDHHRSGATVMGLGAVTSEKIPS